MRMSDFISGLPKAELHVHHVGSASPRIVSELAARHPGTVPTDLEELQRFYEFRDFAHFIEVYLAVVALIRTPQDIGYLTYEVAREMAVGQRLRYAELTCTPYTCRTPSCWPTWPRPACRWRCARRPTSPRGPSRRSRSTRCRCSATRA
ncbi:amidohydrolase family protein [Pseudonocardia charpentierae]|uniref:Adenosine deaminase domain-containing protein n=1 Tax=Pseudonocardia charpentierae TaxID=3075545 RepID=A0ABU2NJ64_9PSEU|nr:hypothetical protein [Pseudonocardia sp. DSM 45834]MDT0352659.1 hypothetical protein [Pseudonocardia sp. DSM 45834]